MNSIDCIALTLGPITGTRASTIFGVCQRSLGRGGQLVRVVDAEVPPQQLLVGGRLARDRVATPVRRLGVSIGDLAIVAPAEPQRLVVDLRPPRRQTGRPQQSEPVGAVVLEELVVGDVEETERRAGRQDPGS